MLGALLRTGPRLHYPGNYLEPMSAPISLTDALGLTNEPRIVTTSAHPHTIVHTNKAWFELTGYKFHEVCGRTCHFMQGEETSAAVLQELRMALTNYQPVVIELVNYKRDGTPFLNRISFQLVAGGTHWLATLSATTIDHGRRAAVDRLPPALQERVPLAPVNYSDPENYERATKRASRTTAKVRLHNVIDNTTDPIVLCSKDYPHEILHPNQPWVEMCGYTLEEVEGLTNKVLTGPETNENAIADLLRCVRNHEPSVQTVVNYKKGGARFLNQVKTLPVYDENEDIAGFMSMLKEVDDPMLRSANTLNGADLHLWHAMIEKHYDNLSGSDGESTRAARAEAAHKLITNHELILRDTCIIDADTPSRPPGHVGRMPLHRIEAVYIPYVDQALREVVHRLLNPGAGLLRERLAADHPLHGTQHSIWAEAMRFLEARLQLSPIPHGLHGAGRTPDMSKAAGTAMREVLREIMSGVE